MDGKKARLRRNTSGDMAWNEFSNSLVVKRIRIVFYRNKPSCIIGIDHAVSIAFFFHRKITGHQRIARPV